MLDRGAGGATAATPLVPRFRARAAWRERDEQIATEIAGLDRMLDEIGEELLGILGRDPGAGQCRRRPLHRRDRDRGMPRRPCALPRAAGRSTAGRRVGGGSAGAGAAGAVDRRRLERVPNRVVPGGAGPSQSIPHSRRTAHAGTRSTERWTSSPAGRRGIFPRTRRSLPGRHSSCFVPVVSTTFASVSRLFGRLGPRGAWLAGGRRGRPGPRRRTWSGRCGAAGTR